jgi:hemolysin D
MQIVPVDKKLEVEAWVQNKDIGFVHEGQVAEVKVETFPFTKYGTIDAEIENLSNDAVSSETLGLVYATRVLLKKSVMMVEGRLINLAPGMAVTVEVKTGKRRIVEFVLSPLLRGMQESARER